MGNLGTTSAAAVMMAVAASSGAAAVMASALPQLLALVVAVSAVASIALTWGTYRTWRARNRDKRFTHALNADIDHEAALERDLRKGLARDEFVLHYQPQYHSRTLQLTSAEALIRWHHPQRGLVSPTEFIPLAEKSHLICEIGEWVVREAADTIAHFQRLGMPLRISVNVSPQQLEQREFVSMVKAALKRSDAAPGLLEVELTESLALRDCDLAAERLKQLVDEGISVAIDDFGTGYSNLACLVRLPVSRLKIDRSLLQGITSRAEVRTLVQTIISLARGLGFDTVAEGIEDAEQLRLISAMGCDVVQGFYLSRPVEQHALEQLVAADRGPITRALAVASG